MNTTIVLVDQDPELLELAAIALRGEGFEVVTATSAGGVPDHSNGTGSIAVVAEAEHIGQLFRRFNEGSDAAVPVLLFAKPCSVRELAESVRVAVRRTRVTRIRS
jgi:DNA-binding response OmpR family regulator